MPHSVKYAHFLVSLFIIANKAQLFRNIKRGRRRGGGGGGGGVDRPEYMVNARPVYTRMQLANSETRACDRLSNFRIISSMRWPPKFHYPDRVYLARLLRTTRPRHRRKRSYSPACKERRRTSVPAITSESKRGRERERERERAGNFPGRVAI
jgi:hypothetical protein